MLRNKNGEFDEIEYKTKRIVLTCEGKNIDVDSFFSYITSIPRKKNTCFDVPAVATYFAGRVNTDYQYMFIMGFLTGFVMARKNISIEVKEHETTREIPRI